jgi:hypothetical protein
MNSDKTNSKKSDKEIKQVNKELVDKLEFYHSGDGWSHEIWVDTTSDVYYKVPIEIVRDWNKIDIIKRKQSL